MIAALLGWTRLPQWVLELLVIAGLACGFWLYHTHVYDTGIKAQQAADNAASAKAETQAAIATQAAQDAANRAEESYREEIANNAARAAARPLGPVRLCIDAHVSGPDVSEASAAHPGNVGASAPAGGIREVPGGNPGVREGPGPDISELLHLLARRADDGSAVEREFQSRGN